MGWTIRVEVGGGRGGLDDDDEEGGKKGEEVEEEILSCVSFWLLSRGPS